jgi:hypothetical protein
MSVSTVSTTDDYITPAANHILSMNLTSEKIRMGHLRLFTSMRLGANTIIRFLEKIENYMYVSNLHTIVPGNIVRILKIHEDEPNTSKMHSPCIMCDILFTDEYPLLQLKTIYNSRYFSISMLNCVVFQKLTSEERLVIAALDYSARQDQDWMSNSDDELSDDEESVASSNDNVNHVYSNRSSDSSMDTWDVINAVSTTPDLP